jgi:hypothetical protein
LSAPFVVSNWFFIELHRLYPTAFKAILVNATLLAQVVRNVKESACHNVAKHEDFGKEQEEFQEGLDSSVHIVKFNHGLFHFDQFSYFEIK